MHRADDRWHDPQDVDALRGGNRDESRSVGTAAEKGNEVSLMRQDSTAMRASVEPARRVRPFATEPTSMSVWVGCASST